MANNKLPKFKFDSNHGVIIIDEKRMSTVTDVNISCKAKDGYAKVTLTFEAEVEVEGDVFILPQSFRRDKIIAKTIDDNK